MKVSACQHMDGITVPLMLVSCAQYMSMTAMVRYYTQSMGVSDDFQKVHGIVISHYESYIRELSQNYQDISILNGSNNNVVNKGYDILVNIHNMLDLCVITANNTSSQFCNQLNYSILYHLNTVSIYMHIYSDSDSGMQMK